MFMSGHGFHVKTANRSLKTVADFKCSQILQSTVFLVQITVIRLMNKFLLLKSPSTSSKIPPQISILTHFK